MMTVFMGPVGVRSSEDAEVRCDEFVIDHEARLEDAVAMFRAAGMLAKPDTHDHHVGSGAARGHFSGPNHPQLWAV